MWLYSCQSEPSTFLGSLPSNNFIFWTQGNVLEFIRPIDSCWVTDADAGP